MKIQADRDVCIGAGMCVLTAEKLFDQSEDDGLVIVLDDQPTDGEDRELAREAVNLCPSGALSVQE